MREERKKCESARIGLAEALERTRVLFFASLTEKIPQDCRAFVLQDTGRDIAPVIEAGHLQKVDHTSRGPRGGIRATENHTSDSCVDERACAHRTRLLSHVKIAVDQAPIANSSLGLG